MIKCELQVIQTESLLLIFLHKKWHFPKSSKDCETVPRIYLVSALMSNEHVPK